MVELGIVGLILLLAVVLTAVRQRFQAHLHLRYRRRRALSAAILAFLVWNLINAVKALTRISIQATSTSGSLPTSLPAFIFDHHGLAPEAEQ